MKYDPKISPRMFESDFIEWFSHIHPATPVVFWLPVIGVVLYNAFVACSVGAVLLQLISGIVLWTLTEYSLHRWVFHYEPRSSWGKRLHFLMHGVHHDYPRDATRLVMPLAISIPIGIVFYTVFRVLLPSHHFGLFAGFALGYLSYDMIHYATHHFAMTSKVGRYLKIYHMRHHFNDSHSGYGVSNPLWDIVFRTMPTNNQGKKE